MGDLNVVYTDTMKWFFVTLFGAVLLAPAFAFAADTSFFGPIVPQCTFTAGNLRICQACDLIALIDNILRFMVTGSVLVAAAMFAYAGFLYITNPSNAGNVKTAHGIFTNVFVGLVIILIAWLAIDIFMRILAGKDLRVLSRIDCVKFEPGSGWSDVGGGRISSSGRTATGGGVSGGGPGTTVGDGQGLGNVDSVTTYTPIACTVISNYSTAPGGSCEGYSPTNPKTQRDFECLEGCVGDASGNRIISAADYKFCLDNNFSANKSLAPITQSGNWGNYPALPCDQVKAVTVAIPQNSGIAPGQKFVWPELAKRLGLPEGTRFQANDTYAGGGYGNTDRGTYSLDIATCGSWNTNCDMPSIGNEKPLKTRPTPVPGG